MSWLGLNSFGSPKGWLNHNLRDKINGLSYIVLYLAAPNSSVSQSWYTQLLAGLEQFKPDTHISVENSFLGYEIANSNLT